MLDENMLVDVTRIVGPDNVDGTGPGGYFRGSVEGSNLVVVRPGSADEIQDLVVLSGERGIPVFTVRSRYAYGRIIEKEGLLLDLSRMDRILDIDAWNMKARIEAGVTFEKMTEALGREGMQLLLPVSAASESVLRSYLDRDPCLGASGLRFSNLSVFKAVLGNGEV